MTAKDTDADYIVGITKGSDDYIVKLKPTFLAMKVKAILRRADMAKNDKPVDEIRCGDFLYTNKDMKVYISGNEIEFTRTELKCLVCLFVTLL